MWLNMSDGGTSFFFCVWVPWIRLCFEEVYPPFPHLQVLFPHPHYTLPISCIYIVLNTVYSLSAASMWCERISGAWVTSQVLHPWRKLTLPFPVAPIATSSSGGVGLPGHLPTACWDFVWLPPAQVLCMLSQRLWVHVRSCSVAFPLVLCPNFLALWCPQSPGRKRYDLDVSSRGETPKSLSLWTSTGCRSLFIVTPLLDLTVAYAQLWLWVIWNDS